MEGLFSLLLFAGFFYLMMRFGCGSHMTHGHHGNKNNKRAETIFDPVCGMKIDENKGYGKLHDGSLYRFCSKKCLDDFDQQPDQYLTRSNQTKPLEEDHHET